jgi:hypothetical protein
VGQSYVSNTEIKAIVTQFIELLEDPIEIERIKANRLAYYVKVFYALFFPENAKLSAFLSLINVRKEITHTEKPESIAKNLELVIIMYLL